MVTIREKKVAPSMRPAATIMAPRISPTALGWRAMPSMAAAASLPMPRPPPMRVRPAPRPAPRYAIALGSISLLLLGRSVCGVHRHPDEDGCQQGEDISLDEGDQQLEHQDEQAEAQGDGDH